MTEPEEQPPKREGRPGGAANPRKLLLADTGADFSVAQDIWFGITWRRWELEAARLFSLYWQSGDLTHCHAFGRHIHAMRSQWKQRS